MSYCRFGADSDVYLFASGDGFHFYIANDTKNHAGEHYFADTAQDALDRIKELRISGLKIPERAVKRLKDEMK